MPARVLTALLLLALAGATARAQSAPAPEPEPAAPEFEMTRVVIPVAGTIPGVNAIEWRTDVELRNPTNADLDVILTMPALPDEPFFMTSVPAGGSLALPNVSARAFGFAGRLSPLVVHTFGRNSVHVNAVAYPVAAELESVPQPIPVTYAPAGPGLYQLGPVTFNQHYRTNVGFVNLGETEAMVTLAVQRVRGRNLALTTIPLPPRSLIHAAINGLFPLLPESEHLTLIVQTENSEIEMYASVIHNETHRATFVSRMPWYGGE